MRERRGLTFIREEHSKEFLESFNKNVMSDEMKKKCDKTEKLFKK